VISVIVSIGSLLLSLEHAGELLNFGALLGFMGVNLAAFRQCYLLKQVAERRAVVDAVIPLLGFLFCMAIWLTLPLSAKLIGGAWLLIGVIYHIRRLRRLRTNSAVVDRQ
jgi:putrescine importer